MNQERLFYLLEKCDLDQCSELELAELDEWFHANNPGCKNMKAWIAESGGVDKLSDYLFDGFKQASVTSSRTKTTWSIIRNVAAATLLFALGYVSLSHLKPALKTVINRPANKSYAIRPGGNKAILTLANGAKILLNGASNGYIALQNNMKISKLSGGRIAYKAMNKAGHEDQILYNTMTTPRGGRFELILADGTEVTLDAESSIVYPVAFTGKERRVEITGQAYFNVSHNASKPFRVHVGNQTIQDIGTAFNVNAYPDDPSIKITLAEGSVNVSNSRKKVSLIPGQQAQVENGLKDIIVKRADVSEAVAWKNGWFVFHHESVKNVMKQAARWYDVDIEFQGHNTTKQLGGSISKYKDISELLENLRIAGGINYKIEGRRIILIN
jgi:ferric-dicitrate binding protein FerR (iron transport regulator)